MIKLCILDKDSKRCVNVVDVEQESDWKDFANLTKAPRHDGQPGWDLLENGEWDTHEIIPTTEQLAAYQRGKRDNLLFELR